MQTCELKEKFQYSRITADNFQAVAEWCKSIAPDPYVPRIALIGHSNSVAYLGDYIVKENGDFIVYKPHRFYSKFVID